MWSKLKNFVRGRRRESLETLPLTPSELSDVPSTSGIIRNYGSIVTLLRKKLTLSSFQNQVIQQYVIAYHSAVCSNKLQHVFIGKQKYDLIKILFFPIQLLSYTFDKCIVSKCLSETN